MKVDFDKVIFGEFRIPLQKVPCGGCGQMVKLGSVSDREGLCVACYADFILDQQERWGERAQDDAVELFICR